MIDADDIPDVDVDEVLARYVVAGEKRLRNCVRENGIPKPQLFLPYSRVDLSVNRHRDCSETEIWTFGIGVAKFQNKKLHGRCDINVADCKIDRLSVVKAPIKDDSRGVPDNPNHADITGFPAEKADQKSLAMKLAAKATAFQSIPSD